MLFERQRVAGDMLQLQIANGFQRVEVLRLRLPRQAVHHVRIDVYKPSFARPVQRIEKLCKSVNSPDTLE
ncbi:hypothetical protein SDC9_149607 [bioreactor metagenome]|uniref:Uncharacterized protein n=1 Tax=bioreactor metagenome TaxID=1076179 RepID=A0A645EK85_9ZZZZ